MSMSAVRALVLFAHGARDPDWIKPIVAVRDKVRAAEPGRRVEMAFLEFISPTLPELIKNLAAEDIEGIDVIPMFIAAGSHILRDLPNRLDSLQAKYPNLKLRLAPPIGLADEVQDAMRSAILRLAP